MMGKWGKSNHESEPRAPAITDELFKPLAHLFTIVNGQAELVPSPGAIAR
jgi:hypothetical protein